MWVSKFTFVFQNPHLCFEIHIYTSWIRVLNPVLKAKIWFCRNVNVGFKTQMWVLKPTFTFQNPDWKTDPTDAPRWLYPNNNTKKQKIHSLQQTVFVIAVNLLSASIKKKKAKITFRSDTTKNPCCPREIVKKNLPSLIKPVKKMYIS